MGYKKNADGYYRSTIVIGYKPDGLPKREVVRSKNLNEFKEKLKAAQNLRDNGYEFDSKNMTVGQWAWKWYETYKKPRVRFGSQQNYKTDLGRHILPQIGHLLLADVKPFMLQEVLNKFEGGSTSHALKIRMTIEQIFRRAYTDGLIVRNVSADLIIPETTAGERRPLTDSEKAGILKAAETHRAGLWILTMLYAGLRPEETVALMWSDISLEKGRECICVKRAAEYINNQPQLKKLRGRIRKRGKRLNAQFRFPSRLPISCGPRNGGAYMFFSPLSPTA